MLYFWVTKVPMEQLSTLTGASPNTVWDLVRNLYYALEESLADEYVKVGKVLSNWLTAEKPVN